MTTYRHKQWNISYEDVTTEQATEMRPEVVAAELTRLHKLLAETQFLLSCHSGFVGVPDSLRYDWPTDDYSAEVA